ncbi:unnamed protein product [Withania somnifera]
MEASQMITQGMWSHDSELLQLPHFTKAWAKKFQENPGKSIECRHELLQMSESQLMDIDRFCQQYPLRRHLQGRTEVGPVLAPGYPKDKEEGWWLVVGDIESNQLVAIKRVNLQRNSRIKLHFSAPAEDGTRKYKLYFVCDSYRGCDEEHTFALDMQEVMAEDDSRRE